jgi:hypothetical protein
MACTARRSSAAAGRALLATDTREVGAEADAITITDTLKKMKMPDQWRGKLGYCNV